MVKLAAPMMSLDASGSLAGAIVFSKWKGRNYARQLVRPANPKSALQVSMRAMLRFLAQDWKNIGATPKASWTEEAAAGNFSKFNAYIQANQRRWREFLPPGQTDTMYGVHALPTATFDSATGGIHHADLAATVTGINQCWGVAIFRSPTGTFTPSLSNCIHILKVTTSFVWTDTPILAGTYYYDMKFFTDDGLLGPDEGEKTCVVT